MIWGLGTGRCGTASLAAQLGGAHELRATMEDLASLKTSGHWAVVDPAFWRVIPQIYEVDPGAKFVWIYRDPVEVVESWLSLGMFEDMDPVPYAWKVEPPIWPEDWQAHQKGAWLWRTINARIREQVLNNFEVRHVSELDMHLNSQTQGKLVHGRLTDKVSLSKVDAAWVRHFCDWMLDELNELNIETVGSTGAWGRVREVTADVEIKDWHEELWT